MKRIAIGCLALAALVLPARVWAGAWAQEPGHLYAKVSGIAYDADEVFNDMGDRSAMGLNDNTFAGRQMFLYVEYGLRPKLTVISQVSAGVLTSEDDFVRSRTTGLADVELGVKYQWLDKPVVVAPMLSVKLPTGYDADYDPALGTGKPDAEARLLVSKSLYPMPLYLSAETGFRKRGGAFSDQVSWMAEVGATPHPRLFAKVFAGGTNTMVSTSTANIGVVGASVQVSEGDYRKVGANAAVQLVDGVWLDLLAETVVDGENVGAGASWGIGLAWVR